jgi:hypothetical protein
MNPWLKQALILAALMLPVQLIAAQKMQSDIDGGFREYANKKGRDTATTIAIILFAAYAFGEPLLMEADWTAFVKHIPFKPLYLFTKGIFPVPADHPETLGIYQGIWRLITFMIPALIYVLINASISTMIWEAKRKQ